MTTAQKYLQFIAENHAQGSGTAQSYVTAIKKLECALRNEGMLAGEQSLWDVADTKYLADLYEFVKQEQKKEDGGIFRKERAKSYWQKGFCSAALKQLSQFVTLGAREEAMLQKVASATNGTLLGKELLDTPLIANPLLIADEIDISSLEGKTALREVEVRQNQSLFRKMILSIYGGQCCLTGLAVSDVLRASHISAWASDVKNRMNPENGLCLSATYDAAFDRHLISFDEDYRLVIAPCAKEHYTDDAFKEHFVKFEGRKINMPTKFLPSQKLLSKHRDLLVG